MTASPRLVHVRAAVALVAALVLVAACGDGIDEGAGSATTEAAPEATTAPTDSVAAPQLPTFEVDALDPDITRSIAEYAGSHSIVTLSDGSYLLAGFDNQSDPEHPERGAVWHSDDLEAWKRVGREISDAKNQQTISELLSIGDRAIAAGTDFSRDSGPQEFSKFDATAWISDDRGSHFEATRLEKDARVLGARVLGDEVVVWGFHIVDDAAVARIWRSADHGDHWTTQSPAAPIGPGEATAPLVEIDDVLEWGGHLFAIGVNQYTDPDADGSFTLDVHTEQAADDPVDVGIWYSDDDGETWADASPGGLAGLSGAQYVRGVVVAGDHLVILAAAAHFPAGNVVSFPENFTATMYSCDQALQQCSQTPLHSGATTSSSARSSRAMAW